jgi:hypothetical protein
MKKGILAAGAAALLALALAGQGSDRGLGDVRTPAPRLYRVIVPVPDIERAAPRRCASSTSARCSQDAEEGERR